MSYLLDTCVISELAKEEPDNDVAAWFAQRDQESLYLSVITFGELERGVAGLPAGRKRQRLQTWVTEDLQEQFGGRVLPIDHSVAVRWGQLLAECAKRGRPMPVVDSLLAATALVHELTIVSRNAKDFSAGMVQVINPWKD